MPGCGSSSALRQKVYAQEGSMPLAAPAEQRSEHMQQQQQPPSPMMPSNAIRSHAPSSMALNDATKSINHVLPSNLSTPTPTLNYSSSSSSSRHRQLSIPQQALASNNDALPLIETSMTVAEAT